MKHIPKSQAKTWKNGPLVDVLEYPLKDKDIDIAIVNMSGGYPESGFVVNEQCKELLYVVSGEGTFVTKYDSVSLQPGSQILIEKGEPFRYNATKDLVLVAACTPAWDPDQHKNIDL